MEISLNTHDSMAPMTAMFDAIEVMSPPRADAGRPTVRDLLTSALGQVLTPEMAAAIELSACRPSFRDRLEALQRGAELVPQVDCPVRNHFAPGVYMREMTIPAGTMVVGAVHKVENLVIVSLGRVLAATPDGPIEVAAGQTLRCMPGTKNAVIALEDSRWSNVYPNPDDVTDEDVLCMRFYGMHADELVGGKRNAQLIRSGRHDLAKELTS